MAKLRLSLGHNAVTAETFGQMSFLGELVRGCRAASTLGAPQPSLLIHRYEVQTQSPINSVSDKTVSRRKNT